LSEETVRWGSRTHVGLVSVIPVRGLSDSSQLVAVGHSFQSYYTVMCPKGLSLTNPVKIVAYTVVQKMSRTPGELPAFHR